MALVLGTNCGFVTEAPTADPGGFDTGSDRQIKVVKDTSPATAGKIIEIGWWCDNVTEEANFEVGLYASDGAVVPGEAGTLLYSEITNVKGTDAGWKRVTVDWDISENTVYWLAVQLDDTITATSMNYATSITGSAIDAISLMDTLRTPLGGGAFTADRAYSTYAVWEAGAPPTGTNQWVNIDDSLRQITEMWANIDDSWRKINQAWVNIDDSFRKLYTI